MEEPINYQSCCRLCLCEKADTLKPIFDQTNNDLQLSQKILHSLTIQINNSDPVTTMVCEDCVEKITNWNFYKQQCIENQKKFQELLDPIVPVPPVTPPPVPALSVSENTTPNSNNVSMGEMTFHIKEEPADHDIHDETRETLQEAVPENLVQQIDQQIYVKNEPLDVDEPMDQEYNEFPPSLSPHPFGLADSESDPALNHLENGVGSSSLNVAKAEQKKILFAMGLKLLQTNEESTVSDELSKIEISYIEKCNAMVNMHKTLVCACHNVSHQNLKGLLSHLRALRIWFPVFTCYNCMITFTDRSTFTRHISRCSSQALNAITKLSNLKKRSKVKTRLYQNFKCTICKFMFSFHEDFCTHVDEDHSMLQFPVHCPCGRVFENVEEYKDHVYVSCLVDFYCDICFITTKTLDEFQKHAKEVHDQSEGFILLQDDNYKVRKPSMHNSSTGVDEAAIVTGKRERKASVRMPLDLLDDDSLDDCVKPNYYSPKTDNRVCPVCYKEYSSYKNMMRHYKTHRENDRHQQQFEEQQDEDVEEEESFYSCPDCGGVFNTLEWKIHLTEKHQSKPCGECGKLFQFQNELEQHRTTHLNLKLYRDSKTQSYKSTMLTSNSEDKITLLCEFCDLIFTSIEDLKSHKLTHGFDSINPDIGSDIDNLNMDSTVTSDMDTNVGFNMDKIENEMLPNNGDNIDLNVNHGMNSELDSSKVGNEDLNMDSDIDPNIEQSLEQTMETGDSDVLDSIKKIKTETPENELNTYSTLWEPNSKDLEEKAPIVDTYPKECVDCGKVCTTGAAYYRHRQIHDKPTPFDVNKHLFFKKKSDSGDEESYHTCKKCFKVFSNKYNLKNHLKSHGINPAITNKRLIKKAICKICQQVFESNEELLKHKQEEHIEEVIIKTEPPEYDNLIFTCDVCVMTFSSKGALKKHKETHNTEYRPVQNMVFCKYCKISFKNTTQLSQHMLMEHDQRTKKKMKEIYQPDGYACNICSKSFQTSGALTTHIGWHKRAQNETNTKLMKHIPATKPKVTIKEEVSEEMRYQCATCLAQLPNDTALQVHILEKHRSVSAIMLIPRCNTCNKDFATQDEYETHKRLHDFLERQKQHEQKVSVQDSMQRVGQSSIVGPKSKSFPCKHCNAAFSRSDTLGAHMRQFHKKYIATEFKCHHCDRIFEKQNSLTIHLKVHEKQRSVSIPSTKPLFSCSICNLGFDLPKDLRAHTITAHPF